jgi:hypothetical protein
MDDEMKDRIDQIEKRVEDFKWYVGIVGGLIVLMFGLVTGLFGVKAFFDADAARTELRESKKEIRDELLGIAGKPEIILLGVNGSSLDNQDAAATVEPVGSTAFKLRFPYIIQNKGTGSSGSLFAKLYVQSDSLELANPNPSADAANYKYEAYLTSNEIQPNPLPAGVSVLNYFWITVNARPGPGKHPAMLKFFYGQNQSVQATFQIVTP